MKELVELKKRYLEEAQEPQEVQRKFGYDPLERLYYVSAILSLSEKPAKAATPKKK